VCSVAFERKKDSSEPIDTVGLWTIIDGMAAQFDQNVVPSLADQSKLLEGLIIARSYTAESVRWWRPCFGLWTGWCCT
jgi:hypothetical protein